MASTWFERNFKFEEAHYQSWGGQRVRDMFQVSGPSSSDIYLTSLKNKERRFKVGCFTTPSLGGLKAALQNASEGSSQPPRQVKMTFQHLVDTDVGDLIRAPSSAGHVFQVASQFNALEMMNPRMTPAMGVTVYEHDVTQGPACAMACPAATVYRNYFVPNKIGGIGQCGDPSQQLDLMAGLGNFFKKNCEKKYWWSQNGYVFPTSANHYATLCQIISKAKGDQYTGMMEALQYGVHWDTEVDAPSAHTICQVFCAALPLAYAPRLFYNIEKNQAWPRLVLRAAYESTILVAGLLALQQKRRVTCYLTKLGGGAFGNPDTWIRDAIYGAIETYAHLPVDVVLVHYESEIPYLYAE